MAPSDPTPATGRVVVVRSRLRIGIGAAVVLVLVAIAVAVLVFLLGSSGVSRTVTDGRGASPSGQVSGDDIGSEEPGGVDPQATGPPASAVFVHLLGAVAAPGLYELRSGDRVVDAVAAAGGFGDGADQAGVNLARLVTDGEQIYVPRIGETPPTGAAPGGSGAAGAGGAPGSADMVNLNTADEAALDSLPGVGPATAGSILAWREENGRFTSVEDLLSVSGIGDKTFADLKDLVTV